VAAGAIGAGAQWLTQASYDWIWNYPGVTAPVMFLLGAAAAPALLDPGAAPRRALRRGGAALLVLLALLAVPLTFSARYLQRAYGETADSPRQAAADLDRAADLNPLDADPLLVKASVELRLGEREAALADLRATLEREPDNFEANLLLARLLAETDPAAAREALREARELNPHSPELDEVEAAGLSEG
jgi:tetratricopeptide (TPR) repeat protein